MKPRPSRGETVISTPTPPQTADIDQHLRAVVSYDDDHGTAKSAQAESAHRVQAAQNQTPDFDPATTERHVEENARAGTAVGGPVTALDPDNDELLYTLTRVGSAPFEIDSQTGQILVADSASLDYEWRRS